MRVRTKRDYLKKYEERTKLKNKKMRRKSSTSHFKSLGVWNLGVTRKIGQEKTL